MKKDFFVKNTVLPIVLGIFTAVIAVMFFSLHPEAFVPVKNNTVLSYYDSEVDTAKSVAKTLDGAKQGDIVGKITADKEYFIAADAPYSALDTVISYDVSGAEFGKAGYVYLQAGNSALSSLKNSISFSTEGSFGKLSYVLVEEKNFGSVDAVKAYAPNIGKGIMVYAQDAGNIGLKSTYTALIFEEVQL